MTATAEKKNEKKKGLYDWTSQDHAPACPRAKSIEKGKPAPACAELDGCCPADLVVNASQRSVVLGSPANIAQDAQRLDPGDRRQGAYYLTTINLPVGTGIQRVRDVDIKTLVELEKQRQIRTGDRPADWVLQARERAKRGEGPAALEDARSAATALQRAAMGAAPE